MKYRMLLPSTIRPLDGSELVVNQGQFKDEMMLCTRCYLVDGKKVLSLGGEHLFDHFNLPKKIKSKISTRCFLRKVRLYEKQGNTRFVKLVCKVILDRLI